MTPTERAAPSPCGGGLRELKKQRTREAIVRAAMDLFAERGFDATTIHDIAAAAEIAPRTFFGYFPSKEAVVFHDLDGALEALAARLHARPAGESAFDAMRAWLLDWIEECDPATDPDLALRRRLIAETPALATQERANMARFEALLAAAVAQDLAVPADSLRPHLVAAAAVAALEAIGRRHDDETPRPTDEQATAVLDEALTFLGGGLEALRELPALAVPQNLSQ